MKIKLANHRYDLEFRKLKKIDGSCSNPELPKRKILIDKTLKDRRLLAVLLHEFMHGLLFMLDEETVENGSTDMAKILWKLGYRKVK